MSATKPAMQDVWQWPEFRAFAERLGIPLHLPTQRLELTLDIDEPVKVYQSYLGRTDSEPKPDVRLPRGGTGTERL